MLQESSTFYMSTKEGSLRKVSARRRDARVPLLWLPVQ